MRAMAIHLAESDGNNDIGKVNHLPLYFTEQLNNTEHIDPRGPTIRLGCYFNGAMASMPFK